MQESLVLTKEVSSCRRAQHCSKRSTHAGELSTRDQLMQESSALTKEVSSALHKSSAHARELNTAQRGQLMQESSAQEISSCRRAQL